MNIKIYTRLFIVSCVPLLLLGIFTAKVFIPYGKYANIRCAPFLGTEYCRDVGDRNGNLYHYVMSEHPAWFDVEVGDFDPKAYLQNFTEASARIVSGAQIVSASPFPGYGSDVASFMGALAGRPAIVNLGIPNKETSFILGDLAILYCNDLRLGTKEGEYASTCYGDGWGGSVGYRVTGASRVGLEKLVKSINVEIDARKADYNLYRIVVYPIFVYLFLFISLLVWLFAKAVRFVKSG